MTQGRPSKITEIKDAISSGIEIMSQIMDPGVRESVRNVKDTTITIQEIIESLKTPEMVKNIENFRIISENINEATSKIQDAVKQLEVTGIIGETKELIKSVKSTTDFITKGQDLNQINNDLKDTFRSVRTLVRVLKVITVS
jgi:hypothetical protein